MLREIARDSLRCDLRQRRPPAWSSNLSYTARVEQACRRAQDRHRPAAHRSDPTILCGSWIVRKISEESLAYQQRHAELKAQYLGQYIAMRDGQVVDHDTDVVGAASTCAPAFRPEAGDDHTAWKKSPNGLFVRHGFRMETAQAMKYPYDAAYEPPFPTAPVVLRNSEEGLRTEKVQALLDTGSDGSLVPIAYLAGNPGAADGGYSYPQPLGRVAGGSTVRGGSLSWAA